MLTLRKLSLPFIAISFLLSQPSLAAYQALDKVKIVVNKDVITFSQFQSRLDETRNNLKQAGQNYQEALLAEQVTDQLIIESLQLQMAERAGVRVSDQELSNAVNDIAKRNKMSIAQLKVKIEREGQNFESFRERIKTDMMIQHVQRGHLRSKVTITDKAIDDYLASSEGQQLTQESYDISYLTLSVDSDASKQGEQQAKKAMQALRNSVLGKPAAFANYVKGKTYKNYNITGAHLGRRQLSELPSLFTSLTGKLSSGEISSPLRSGAGWHLVRMNQKIGGQRLEFQVNAKHILIKPSAVRSDEQALKLANELIQRVKDGEDFELLAKEYSEDTGSALQGGNLGWANPNSYVPPFTQALLKLKDGELSQAVKTDFGWHIMIKIAERDHDITREEQRSRARQILGQKQFNEALESWINEIKGEAYIDIKS